VKQGNLLVSFDPPDDWACWRPGPSGLTEDERIELTDGVGFRDSAVTQEAIRAIDQVAHTANDDDGVAVCGVWFPSQKQGLPVASLFVRMYSRSQPRDLAVQQFLAVAKEPPSLPGCLISHYESFQSEVDLGILVGSTLVYSEASGDAACIIRYVIFPEVADEVAVFDFSTQDLNQFDALSDSSVQIINNAYYLQEDE